ncbi:MAG: hypothetical protein IBX36_01065 [Dehalococcoidia bacterium]|nr:hypothetical protein [Dehalococcoidia bacterium]
MRGLSRLQLILILGVVALVAVNIVLVVFYFQAESHQAAVASDIEETQASIARMSVNYDIDRLAAELVLLQGELAKAPIPTTVDNVEVYDAIHLAAVKARVNYDYEYKTKSVTIGQTRYTAMTFEIDTSGTLLRIIRFLGLLEDLRETDYNTLRITDINLDLSAPDTWHVEFTIEIIVQGG